MAYTQPTSINNLEAKTTPVDADVVVTGDSADSVRGKKVTWANIKATLKTYFDTLYVSVSSFVLASGKTVTIDKTMSFTSADDTGVYTMPTGTKTIAATTDIPVKASGAELDTGTDDTKFATAKAINDSHNVPSVAPGTSGNIMTSNGTDWTSAAFPLSFSTVVTTYDMSTASGTQTIAHGLGKTPVRISVKGAYGASGADNFMNSFGSFYSGGNKCIWTWFDVSASWVGGNSGTYSIILASDSDLNPSQQGAITVDATNITVTWTKTGTITGTAQLIFECEG